MDLRFKPLIGKMFYIIWIPTLILMIIGTVLSVYAPLAFIIMMTVDALLIYFMLTSLFGYVELRESAVFVKFGFILQKEIPYGAIRGITREHKFYSDSMVSLKLSMDHVNIKFGRFDMVSVSVVDNDELISEIEKRMQSQG